MSQSAQRSPSDGDDDGRGGVRRRSGLDRLATSPARHGAGSVPPPNSGPDGHTGSDGAEVTSEPTTGDAIPPANGAVGDDDRLAPALPAWLTGGVGTGGVRRPTTVDPDAFGIGDLAGDSGCDCGEGDGRGEVGGRDEGCACDAGCGCAEACGCGCDGGDDPESARARFALAPPAAIAIILVGIIACGVAGLTLLRDSGSVPAVEFPSAGAPTQSGGHTEDAAPTGRSPSAVGSGPVPAPLVVSVVGLVHRPGLVTLRSSARVADAIAAAGGTRQGADTVSLNLAQVVRDGDQILIGYSGPEGQMALRSAVIAASGATSGVTTPTGAGGSVGGGAAPSGGASPGSLVNLNAASESELDALPGVGPVTARAIIDWRGRNGGFTSVDQLGEVDGIGPARLAKLRALVTV